MFRRALTEEAFEALARRTLQRPEFMVSSDGLYHGARPHPRGYGTFARILGRYVRELGVLRLEDAVRRMSGLPAERFAIRDRGLIAEGLAADLVVFDPATVAGPATWEEPRLRGGRDRRRGRQRPGRGRGRTSDRRAAGPGRHPDPVGLKRGG